MKVDSNKKEKMEEIPLDEKKEIDVDSKSQVHCKKKFSGFPVPSPDVTNQTLIIPLQGEFG